MKEKEEILARTSGGLDIFVHYLGKECLKRKFKSPFRDDDNRPSCKLYLNQQVGGRAYYYLHDFGDSRYSGDCFFIAAQILNINLSTDFVHLLKQIDRDLSLGVFDHDGEESAHVNRALHQKAISARKEIQEDPGISFRAEVKSFSQGELAYWGAYGITAEILSRFHVESLKSCVFTKTDGRQYGIYSTSLTPSYGYFFKSGKGIKVYRPRSENRFLYAGELPSPYVFGYDQLPERGKVLLITGGEKDVLSLCSHGFSAICFNSETAKVPSSLLDQLKLRFEHLVFVYDVDATGLRESTHRVEELKASYPVSKVVLPLAGSKQEKDVSDFFKLGGTRETLENLIFQLFNN